MIDGISGRLPLLAARGAATTAPVAPPAHVKPASPDRSTLAAVARGLASAPPVDTAKVERIKIAISTGAYAVDPDAVAERMIAIDLHRG